MWCIRQCMVLPTVFTAVLLLALVNWSPQAEGLGAAGRQVVSVIDCGAGHAAWNLCQSVNVVRSHKLQYSANEQISAWRAVDRTTMHDT